MAKDENIRERQKLHSSPFNGVNNRKQTLSRLKTIMRVQNIPVYSKGAQRQFLGFKYIFH